MKIPMFVTSLLPTLSRDLINEDCRLIKAEIQRFTLPPYEEAAQDFRQSFKNKYLQQLNTSFLQTVKGEGANMVAATAKILKNSVDLVDELDTLVEKTFDQQVASLGLTYQKTNALQLLEITSFYVRYARRFLIYIYELESDSASAVKVSEIFAPAETKWLEENFATFVLASKALATKPQELRRLLYAVPDIVVTPETHDQIMATTGTTKIDPLQLGLVPFWKNPIFHIGLRIGEWQALRYKTAQEELKTLQLQKLQLEMKKANKQDAVTDRELKAYADRIQDMTYKMEKMEKDYA